MKVDIEGQTCQIYTGGADFDRSQPCLMFIHGAGMDHTFWATSARYFARSGYSVLVPDLPGHGGSPCSAPDSISAYADHVLALLTSLNVAQAALVGHSMGSLVAMEMAARQPSLVTRLVLLGAAFPMRVSDALLDAANAEDPSAYDMVAGFGTAYRSRLHGGAMPGGNLYRSLRLQLARNRRGTLFNALTACNTFDEDALALTEIICPTTFIVADQDMMTPAASALALAGQLPAGRTLTVANCGHMLVLEQAQATQLALHQALIDGD